MHWQLEQARMGGPRAPETLFCFQHPSLAPFHEAHDVKGGFSASWNPKLFSLPPAPREWSRQLGGDRRDRSRSRATSTATTFHLVRVAQIISSIMCPLKCWLWNRRYVTNSMFSTLRSLRRWHWSITCRVDDAPTELMALPSSNIAMSKTWIENCLYFPGHCKSPEREVYWRLGH